MEEKTFNDKKSENDVTLDEIDISSVLSSLDERLGSLDENNVIENETFDKKDVFTKKPFAAQSPESREDIKRQAEESLQALAESVKEYAEEIKKEAEEKETTKTKDEKDKDAAAGFIIVLFLLWCFCGDHDRRRYNHYYDQYY